MMEQEAINQLQATTTPFCSDPNVEVQAVVEASGGGGHEVKQELELGLGLESDIKEEKVSFWSDPNVENPNGEKDDHTDEIEIEIKDDEEAERFINEELMHLVLDLAMNEQRSFEDYDENGVENIEVGGENVVGDELENGDVVKEEKYYSVKKFAYPLRPDAEDCSFYMKTGSCKFGPQCKFNHPPIPRRKFQVPKEKARQRDDYHETSGQNECKYYLSPGGCKYGKACRNSHSREFSRERSSAAPTMELNFLGLPIRPGEKECTYYMRNGSCKYGSNCRFNHPDPTAVGGHDLSSGYGNSGSLPGHPQSSVSSWSSPRALNETASYVPMMFSPTQGVPSSPEWNSYQAPVYTTSERGLPTPPAFAMNSLATETNFSLRPQQPMLGEEYPERPGQPECSFFMKTGDCKYRFSCKFHHPKRRMNNKSASCSLSDKGLPLRPDQAVCSFYNRYGLCKFGPSCRFDHPENLTGSVSNYEESSFSN